MQRPSLPAFGALLALLLSCGATAVPGTCVPDESRPCACADGSGGAQLCNARGTAFLACACKVARDAGADGENVTDVAPDGLTVTDVAPDRAPSPDAATVDAATDAPSPDAAMADAAMADAAMDAPRVDVTGDAARADASADALTDTARADASEVRGVPTPTDTACPSGRTHCGRCVDVQRDPIHCGACGRLCNADQICAAGVCVAGCAAPRVLCGGRCIDTATHHEHCGSCTIACGPFQGCVAGRCAAGCAPGFTRCVVDGAASCVNLNASFLNCGACGRNCGYGGFCNNGVCTRSPGPTDVAVTYPNLFPNPSGPPYLPSFMAHLMGTPVGLMIGTFPVCIQVRNPTTAIYTQGYEVDLPGYADSVAQNRFIRPGYVFSYCISPVFDVVRLQALTAEAPASLRTVVGSSLTATQSVTLLPRNTFTWLPPRPAVPREDMDSLSAVWITPHDASIEARFRDVERRSVFPDGFGSRPYERNPCVRLATVTAPAYAFENVFLEAGEELASVPTTVTRTDGTPATADLTLMTSAQYDAWRRDRSAPVTMSWRGIAPGSPPASYIATTSGWYVLALTNPASTGSLRIVWTRSLTHEDIAEDALRAVYDQLAAMLPGIAVAAVTPSTFTAFTTVRRPRTVLADRAGTTADLAFTAASFIELIGMDPVVHFTDTNVWVGVRAHPSAPMMPTAPVWSMDLSQLGRVPFAIAFDDGVRAARSEPLVASYYDPMDVQAARSAGVFPQP